MFALLLAMTQVAIVSNTWTTDLEYEINQKIQAIEESVDKDSQTVIIKDIKPLCSGRVMIVYETIKK